MDNSSFIQDLGRSFIISALLPASVFIFFVIFVLLGGFQLPVTIADDKLFGPVLISIIVFTILSGWLGYALYSSTTSIFQLYEGYSLPRPLKNILLRQQKYLHQKRSESIKSWEETLKQKEKSDASIIGDLRQSAYDELQSMVRRSPIDENYLLPTELGNVLRASELYSNERYGIEGLVIWPRLFRVFPQNFISQMEEQNNQMVFLLNSSFLAGLTSILCIVIWLFRFSCSSNGKYNICNWIGYREASFREYVSLLPMSDYLIIGIVLIILSYIFYRASVTAAMKFAFYVQTGFDLYRFELLRQLNLPLPKDFEDEHTLWVKVSELFVAGHRLMPDYLTFNYSFRDELINESEKRDSTKKIGYGIFFIHGSGRRKRSVNY